MKKIIIPLIALVLTACQSTTTKTQSNHILSKSVGMHIASIYDQFQIGNIEQAIVLAKNLVPKTDYDQAYINQMIGMMYVDLGKEQAGISYLQTALNSKALSPASNKRAIESLEKLNSLSVAKVKDLISGDNPQFDTPVVHISPRYPIQAARNGVEGYVEMTFDILENGSVTNINVSESQPKGVFDKEAVRALARWKYLPAKSKEVLEKRKNKNARLDFALD
ncbi:MAG: TonB family protein [Psychrobium sp.]